MKTQYSGVAKWATYKVVALATATLPTRYIFIAGLYNAYTARAAYFTEGYKVVRIREIA